MKMAFFDIRVLHSGAKFNANHNTPEKMCNKHDRERKKGNMETAVYRSKKESAMALYSRPTDVWVYKLLCSLNE